MKSLSRWIAICLGVALVAADADAESDRAFIAGLPALRETRAWDLRRPPGMSLEGTVTFVDPAAGWLVVQEGKAAAAIHARAALSHLHLGDRVRLTSPSVYPTIPSVAGFPFAPATSEIVPSFQTRTTNQPDYVDRFRGYVVPPQTGTYRFWITTDDSSELWLSDNDDPTRARKIASVPTWTEDDEWSRFPSQRSQPVELQAGQRYYIEVLHEQADGADHLTVAWERTDRPREVIGGQYLFPYASTSAEPKNVPPASAAAPVPHGILREVWRTSAIGSPADLQSVPVARASFEAENLACAILAPGSLPPPHPIKVGQALSRTDDFRWAETAAEIRSIRRVAAGLELELSDGENRMLAHVQSWTGPAPSLVRGYLVRLTGVCEAAFGADGRRVPGTLWIQQLGELTLAGTSPSWNLVPPTHLSELAPLAASSDADIPVRVRGRVLTRTSDRSFTLEDEGTFSAYASSDGQKWKTIGDEVHVPMRDPVWVGLAVTSHGPQTTLAKFDHVSGLAPSAPGEQIGNSSPPGHFAYENGTYAITGVGNDIWEWQDDFFFVPERREGDGEFVAHLDSVAMHSVWAKAGVMFRQSLAPDAPFVDLVNVGGNRLSLQWRVNSPHRSTEAVYTQPNDAPSWLKLVRRHHACAFATLQPSSAQLGELVDAFGFLHRTATGLTITDGFTRPIPTVDAAQAEEDERPLIEIHSLATWGRSSVPNYFRLRGVVTCNRPSPTGHYFAVQDATGGIFLFLNNAVDRQTIKPGTLVDVYCDPITTGMVTQGVTSKVVPLGPATMPRPIPHPMELLGPSKGDGQWIEVEGVVYAADKEGATLRAAGSYVALEATGMSREDWSRLIDRRVRVQGVASNQSTSELKVIIPGNSYVEAVAYGESALPSPVRSLADLAAPKALADPAHRVQVVGTAMFVHGHLAIIDDGSGTASVELEPGGETAGVGDKVEVIGFPTTGPNGELTLVHSSLHRLGPGAVPSPVRARASAVLDGAIGQRLVTFDAEVLGTGTSETGDILDLQSDGRKFRAWCPSHSPALETMTEGSRIRLTGFAYRGPSYLPSDPISTADRERIVHFIVRSPDDIGYLEGPPWLRLKRALYTLSALACAFLLVVIWAQVLRRRVKQRTEQLNATLAKLRQETALAATLTERQRLAGEIHDSLEQGIAGIMLQLEAALQSPNCTADIRETIGIARNMVSFSHAEIRHAIWDLHSPVLEGKTLHTALQQMTSLVGVGAPAIDVALHGTPVPLPPEIEHHLLRIAQEAVTNAVKHANATKIAVDLTYRPGEVGLRVKDDGRGFSTESHRADTTHFGLRSLRRRAKKMNAILSLQSTPQGGTVVEVVVPLAPEVVT